MRICWRRFQQACPTAPGWPWASTDWQPSPSMRRGSPTPWPSPSTTPDSPELILAARQVLARARVDTHSLAFADEQRHPHHRAGFQLCGLGAAGRGIATNTRIGLDHLEFHVRGRGHLQRHAVPQRDDAHGSVLQALCAVAHRFFGGGELFERLGHHEVEEIAVPVQILHIRIDHIGGLHGVPRLPCALDGAARFEVAHPDAVEGLTFARLDHFVLDDRVGIAVDQDLETGLEFVRAVVRHRRPRALEGAYHSRNPPPWPISGPIPGLYAPAGPPPLPRVPAALPASPPLPRGLTPVPDSMNAWCYTLGPLIGRFLTRGRTGSRSDDRHDEVAGPRRGNQ